jgi:hypothetical protein
VKFTWVPEHTVVDDAEIETLTGSNGLTVMVMPLEVAGFPVAQISFDDKTQVTTSVLEGE